MVEVKICGLSDESSLDAAIAGGARYVGLVFFPKSPRHVSLDQAAALANRARGKAQIVAVTVDADDAVLQALAARVQPDFLQLHGAESPARIAASRSYAKTGLIKAVPLATDKDLAALSRLSSLVDAFLFDAKPPTGAHLPGGNGAAFDWQILADFRSPKPWFLSGGLTLDNVQEAIAASKAIAVDVSSGVETTPGVKDRTKIMAFLAAAQRPHPQHPDQTN
jgi:phosphoribosylanthranilate isomerase